MERQLDYQVGHHWAGVFVLAGMLLAMMPSLSLAQEAQPPQQPATTAGPSTKPDDILNMDIEQLSKAPVSLSSDSAPMDLPVTSVTKEASTVGRSAAAVFVITPEMIRRSGATSIPEALRMAPGMEVAQMNSNAWAISCRGFNQAYSGKLLILIDGRAVYNPNMAGVFWNVQDVLLEDVERIEVIRGPGGTLWGANAVNGVVNIITKRANDTQGVFAQAGGGTHEKDFEAFRYGGLIGEDIHYRIYGKHFERGPNSDPNPPMDDAWRQGRFGFRADWEPGRDKTNIFTVQGDHYVGTTGNSVIPLNPTVSERLTGENLLMRWRHVYDEDSDWSLQAYYDNYTRIDPLQTEIDKTFDVDFQYRFQLTDRHKITWGGGFRNIDSYLPGGDSFGNWYPYPTLTTNYTNEFIQDEITLIEDRLAFTLGCKLEQNPYTGLEYQPTARLLLTPDHQHSAWCAVSRAVRTPSRANRQLAALTSEPTPEGPLSIYPRIYGSSGVVSEDMLAYEIGYREQTTEQFSWDLALFYNSYNHLVAHVPQPPPKFEPLPWPHLELPMYAANGQSGETYGVELAADYAIRKWWRLHASYTYLNLHVRPPSQQYGWDDPPNQVYLRSAWDIREDMDFDLICRYVDRLSAIGVPSYISMDLRLAYRPRKHLEFAVVGQNLLQEQHQEFNAYPQGAVTEVPRGVYGTVTWQH